MFVRSFVHCLFVSSGLFVFFVYLCIDVATITFLVVAVVVVAVASAVDCVVDNVVVVVVMITLCVVLLHVIFFCFACPI